MKIVIVGSLNPIKLEVTKRAFTERFPDEDFAFKTHNATSGVNDQPIGADETRTGAKNRAEACHIVYPNADYCVGLEGGLEIIDSDFWVSAWMCIVNRSGVVGFGRTGAFLLPPEVTTHIKAGLELGHATDLVFNKTNSKHKEGAIGALTDGLITRADFYHDALLFALIPFCKPELYKDTLKEIDHTIYE